MCVSERKYLVIFMNILINLSEKNFKEKKSQSELLTNDKMFLKIFDYFNI